MIHNWLLEMQISAEFFLCNEDSMKIRLHTKCFLIGKYTYGGSWTHDFTLHLALIRRRGAIWAKTHCHVVETMYFVESKTKYITFFLISSKTKYINLNWQAYMWLVAVSTCFIIVLGRPWLDIIKIMADHSSSNLKCEIYWIL